MKVQYQYRQYTILLCSTVLILIVMLLTYMSKLGLNTIDQSKYRVSNHLHLLEQPQTASPKGVPTGNNPVSPVPTGNKATTNVSSALKKFVYLTQTESCLYSYLASPQQLGDPTSCQCDILVLSYKKKCNDSSLPHVEYIFDPKSTWTTGRNLLYRTVMKRKQRYLYYTFLDDDIKLVFKQKPQGNSNPWREYEKSLLKVRPLIGVSWDRDVQHFSKYYNGQCKYPNKTDFLPLIWYDAMFNSFLYEGINYFLPYYDKMENVSIWYSQLYLIMKTDLMFPGQALHHLNVLAKNPQHRPYPQKDFDSNTVRLLLPDLKSEIPVQYHKQLEPRLQEWVKNVRRYHDPTYHCPTFPAVRTPPVPFGHL